MSVKQILAVYNGVIKQLQPGDETPDASIARLGESQAVVASEYASIAFSVAERGSGVLKHYEKQVGSDGASSNTVFTLTDTYTQGDNGLMVFINGQKAEKVSSATDATEYEETSSSSITFGASLQDGDVVEFYIFSILNGDPYIVSSKAVSEVDLVSEVASISESFARNQEGSEASSIAQSEIEVVKSIALSAESQGVLDNSISDRALSIARTSESQGTLDNSLSDLSDSIANRAESLAKKAESQGVLDNSLADAARSVATLAASLARTADLSQANSIAVVADSIADLAEGKASNADSVAERASSLARVAVETSDISEASSIGQRGISIARLTESVSDRAESFAVVADSISDANESVADRTESLARFLSTADLHAYTITASSAGVPREGRLVYLTTSANTVGLAKANAEVTMPAFGVILHDGDTSVKVKTLNNLYQEVKADSDAAVGAGDNIFISPIEGGKVTETAPTVDGQVVQFIGNSDQAVSSANIDLQFQPALTVTL